MRKLSVKHSLCEDTQDGKVKKGSPKSLLDAFERIVEAAHNSELREEFFNEEKKSIAFISKKLGISKLQAVLLSIFVDKSEDSRIRPSEIASFLDIRTVRMLKFMEEIDGLVGKHYLKSAKRGDDRTFSVPTPVLNALRENIPYVHTEEPVNDTQEFFDRFKKLMREMDDNEIDNDYLRQKTIDLIRNDIKDTLFAKGISRYSLDEDNLLLFVYMAHLFIENDDNNINFNDIENIYDDDDIPSHVKRSFRQRTNELFYLKLIENVNEDGMARADAFKLTDKAKEELLSEVAIVNIGKSQQNLLQFEEIAEKKLIYNDKEGIQMKELSSILSPERFKSVQERLKDSGLRQGFCCIFYGSPGTGKTESVYQIARQTGRNIMQVDVDKIKSCWVGESEKNIKGLFDRYRNICKNSDLAPILLFNEADAVLGTRMEGASRAVDKMENSIQNIILQEMEKLDGIMIATTNLTSNLDTAFERRFLYKVKFEKPSVESRAKIWTEMLPMLSEDESLKLASKFNLSGGEIENVVRKFTVNSILTGTNEVDMDYLEESCKLERLNQSCLNKIGF